MKHFIMLHFIALFLDLPQKEVHQMFFTDDFYFVFPPCGFYR